MDEGKKRGKKRKRVTNLSENRKGKRYRQRNELVQSDSDAAQLLVTDVKHTKILPVFISKASQTETVNKITLSVQTEKEENFSMILKVASKSVQVKPTAVKTCEAKEITSTSTLHTQTPKYFFPTTRKYFRSKPKGFFTRSKKMNDLIKNGIFGKFIEKLVRSNQISMFANLVESIADEKLPTTNLAWKSALYRGKWCACKSTHEMRYDEEYKDFWSIVQLLFGSSATNLLRGPAHFGKVVDKSTKKNRYDPMKGKCIFSIPSSKTLNKKKLGFDKVVPCGIINHTMNICEERSKKGEQFTLSFDGKMVSEGLKNNDEGGDVDLWGIEKPMSVKKAIKLRNQLISSVKGLESEKALLPPDVKNLVMKLRILILNISKEIRKLRTRIKGEFFLRKRLFSLVENNPNRTLSYKRSLSRINANTAACENVIRRGLELNNDLCQSISHATSTNACVPPTKHVVIAEQPNAFNLLPAQEVSQMMDITDRENYVFIQQRSNEWAEIRKSVRLTASTLNRAIGLDGLANQKKHHAEFVKKKVMPLPEPEVREKMDHGIKFEINGTATVLGILMPALLPNCYRLFEIGCKVIDSDARKNFFCISPDGMLQCCAGEDCPNKGNERHRRILIEIKSPFPNDDLPEEPYYELPGRHVPQLLSQMFAFEADELWLICCTAKSVSVIEVHFDNELWKLLFSVGEDLYVLENPPIPTKLHPHVKRIKEEIKRFCKTHCKFLLEVPTYTGVQGQLQRGIDDVAVSPFGVAPHYLRRTPDLKKIQSKLRVLAEEAKLIFTESHSCLRQLAREALIFMLNTKDRVHELYIPNCVPVGFGLKGKSLSTEELRYMVDKMRNEIKKRKISVLTEVYDGQWKNLVVADRDGFPLTRLQLTKLSWDRISKLSKEKILLELIAVGKMYQGDKDLMKAMYRFPPGTTELANVVVQRSTSGGITAWSLGGGLYKYSIFPYVVRPCEIEYLLQKPVNQIKNQLNTNKKKVQKIGLQQNEENLITLLDKKVVDDIMASIEEEEHIAEELYSEPIFNRAVQHDRINILEDILMELVSLNANKWFELTTDDLFPGMLQNPNVLMQSCTLKDLKAISKVMEMYTERIWYSSKMTKKEIVNTICSGFNGKNLLLIPDTPMERRVKHPKSLQLLCKEALLHPEYTTSCLRVSYAYAVHEVHKMEWNERCLVDMTCLISSEDSTEYEYVLQHYSYPEYSKERDDLEFRTLDYTHMLTNMRTHILTNGYDFCPTEHFHRLADERPDILSRAAVYDKVDVQNAFFAMKMFSFKVEKFMRENISTETSDFIRIVRRWHEACDKRGLSADQRVARLGEMHRFLISLVDLETFPFIYTRHIKGMPIQTYEAILQNISTRIQLYDYAIDGTYNARSVGTLGNESLHADMMRMDKESPFFPKACNVGKIMGDCVTLNYFKHHPNKTFPLMTTLKGTYPVHVLEKEYNRIKFETRDNHQGLYRDSIFDLKNQHVSKRRTRRDDISTGLAPLRCVPGVRQHHRVDESKILAETRMGLKPKGFNRARYVRIS